jgi:gamma-glutamylcyclotransferase (GGCT)/AIG2-like uncharacterized protein YtfP
MLDLVIVNQKTMHYFAYGSNLSHAQMKRRCPSSVFVDIARLDNYKLIFCGFSERWNSAGANIIPHESSVVWGALYSLNEADQLMLDSIEADQVPTAEQQYLRFTSSVTTRAGKKIQAGVYYSTVTTPLENPGDAYLSAMRDGIADCNLKKYEDIIFSQLQATGIGT